MPETEAMVIPKKQAVKAIVMESFAGILVGLEQVGLEQVDQIRINQGNLKDANQFESAQNFVPFVQTGLAIVLATATKSKMLRTIGSLLIGPSAAFTAYRGAKFLPLRIQVAATRMTSNQRSIAQARQNNAGRMPASPGQKSAMSWTPSGLTA